MGLSTGVGREPTSPFTRVLVPVDGSDASVNAARVAIGIAAVHHLPVVVLYVVADRAVEEMRAMSGNSTESVRRQLETKGYGYLEHIARMALDYGVECERVVRQGVPHLQIDEVVRAHRIDLVVMGETRRESSRRALLGGVTEHVIEYVPCSVLVVKAE
jgi:nucleotide-binding universal stress UspA family protein